MKATVKHLPVDWAFLKMSPNSMGHAYMFKYYVTAAGRVLTPTTRMDLDFVCRR